MSRNDAKLFGPRLLLALAVSFLGSEVLRADDKDVINELRARMEALEKQNQQLLDMLKARGFPTAPPAAATEPAKPADGAAEEKKAESKKEEDRTRKIIADYLKEKDEQKKKEDEEKAERAKEEGFEVGKNLGLKGVWSNYQPWFETEDKAFRFHAGGRVHVDSVWGQASDRVQSGVGGTGKFDDGVNFRRVRATMEGWYYEVFDFVLEVDFTQTINIDPTLPANAFTSVSAVPALTENYASINHLPLIGTLRIGNQKPPILLEHLTSSRFLDFMERSAIFDPYFNRNNGFGPGIMIANWTEDERLTWQLGVWKNTQTIQPFGTGDGDYQLNARVTGLPWYEAEGRYMMHLGLGVQYAEPDHATAVLRERWLLRNGPPTTQNTVALATLNGHNQFIAVPEFFLNLGPFMIQAEYLVHHMDNIRSFTTQPQGPVVVKGAPKSFFSHGGYVELMYFLTGENRPYDRTALHTSGARPTRVVPLRNFFWVPGCGCTNPFSAGAWQVGLRYSYSDLSNNGIYGGQVNEVTFGLNWFLNPNMKVQWNYDVGYRGQLGPGSTANGTYQGFGTTLRFDF